jgi:hypothetical protein
LPDDDWFSDDDTDDEALSDAKEVPYSTYSDDVAVDMEEIINALRVTAGSSPWIDAVNAGIAEAMLILNANENSTELNLGAVPTDCSSLFPGSPFPGSGVVLPAMNSLARSITRMAFKKVFGAGLGELARWG